MCEMEERAHFVDVGRGSVAVAIYRVLGNLRLLESDGCEDD